MDYFFPKWHWKFVWFFLSFFLQIPVLVTRTIDWQLFYNVTFLITSHSIQTSASFLCWDGLSLNFALQFIVSPCIQINSFILDSVMFWESQRFLISYSRPSLRHWNISLFRFTVSLCQFWFSYGWYHCDNLLNYTSNMFRRKLREIYFYRREMYVRK